MSGFFIIFIVMKAIEVIYNLRGNLQESGSSLSTKTDQHLMFMLDEARAVLASQQMTASGNMIQMSQILDVVPVKTTDLGTVTDQAVYKAEIKEPISSRGAISVFTVGPLDGGLSYTQISYSQLRTAFHRKYTANSPKWLILDNYMYFFNLPSTGGQNKIRIRGVFARPMDVALTQGEVTRIKPFDFEYPISLKDLPTVYQIAMSGDLAWGDQAISSINAARNEGKKDQELINALKNLGNAQVQEESS